MIPVRKSCIELKSSDQSTNVAALLESSQNERLFAGLRKSAEFRRRLSGGPAPGSQTAIEFLNDSMDAMIVQTSDC